MRRFLYILFCALTPCLYSQESSLQVTADEMCYENKKLLLEGNVILQNNLGQLKSKRALFYRPDAPLSSKSSTDITMEEEISILMKDGGTLTCHRAHFNSDKHRATFEAKNNLQPAHYHRNLLNAKGKIVPIDLQCYTMDILLNPNYSPDGNGQSSHSIEEITADRQVLIHYDSNIVIASDYARYDCYTNTVQGDEKGPAAGMLYLTPKPERRCRISFGGGHVIEADEICVNTLEQTFYLDKPIGDLLAIYDDGPTERIEFSSEMLYWEKDNQLLVLNGNVWLYGRGLGTFTTDKEMRIQLATTAEGEQTIKTIESFGKTILTYHDEDNKEVRTLTCHERAFIDHQNLYALLESPCENGVVPADLRLYYEDRAGTLSANTALLHYKTINNIPSLNSLLISGNVEMENTSSIDPKDTKPVHQIAIADRVEFFADENRVNLLADEGKRVLYFDVLNQIQMSAPGVNASRDGKTGKEHVKGIGTVRFSFLDSELNTLYQRFNFKQNGLLQPPSEESLSDL